MSNKKPNDWKQTLHRLWGYVDEQRSKLFIVFFLVVLSSGLGLLGPFLIGKAIDLYIVTKQPEGLMSLLLGLFAVYLLYAASLFLQSYWMIHVSQDTVSKLRRQLFRHLHRLPLPYFDKRQHGEIMSRAVNDVENISSTLNSSVIQVVSSVITLIGTISVMLWLSPLLTLLTMMIVPLLFAGMTWITARTGPLFQQQQRNLGEINGFVEEMVSGQSVMQIFSQEERVIKLFMEKNEKLKKTGYWAQVFSGFIPKLMNVLNNGSFAVIACIGGVLALRGMVTVGTIVIFAEYARQFTRPLNDLANQFNTLLSAIAGAERVFETLDEEPEEDEIGAREVEKLQGHVEFINVSFSYGEEETLTDVSFRAHPGETVAFVGPTGAGKTTITGLLSRFYEPAAGDIRIDGQSIKNITRESLRRQMGFVLQDTVLLAGSIRENIRYGRLDATEEEVVTAAHMAGAHAFISKLPNGYDTVIGPDGSGISQGQRQLLAIARVMLAAPAILVLDEATSSIDTLTEQHVQQALARLMKGRTCFIIAHRLNTIRTADHIVVLQEGRVIEQGSHEELVESGGLYERLHQYYQ
ncbi:ABC transporter ATP-binding protein/permease [Ectobacillus sp. JY-23]|uniref:ABC transporter ATP-binding protein n=1 Tax=Ectobacillus sp. JY-23 TaxID=2933872 RepID=UPI001FF2F053|nr:ABC transporter ATP-binding protein [Ectobacillus sp. JY-23]UOY92570.1 ABC transporter ATP-binding protein/permease [Ectobacillus sp. JY-23]